MPGKHIREEHFVMGTAGAKTRRQSRMFSWNGSSSAGTVQTVEMCEAVAEGRLNFSTENEIQSPTVSISRA